MGIQACHQQVVEYLQSVQASPGITHVLTPNAIVQYVETQMSERDIMFPTSQPGVETGVSIFTWMMAGDESRLTIGGTATAGPGGSKWAPYRLGLNCYLRSKQPRASVAMKAAEDFLDSLISAIRSSKNAGGPSLGSTFMWGEGAARAIGGTDISWKLGEVYVFGGPGGDLMTNIQVETWVIEIPSPG